MYLKGLQLCLAHRTLPLRWLLFPDLILTQSTLQPHWLVVFLAHVKHVYFSTLRLRLPLQPGLPGSPCLFCSPCSGIFQVSSCLSFVLAFSNWHYLCVCLASLFIIWLPSLLRNRSYKPCLFATVSQGPDQYLADSKHSKLVVKWMGTIVIASKVVWRSVMSTFCP